MKVGVNPIAREKLAMGSGFYDATTFDHADAVRMRHRAQAVGDDQRGAAGAERAQGVLNGAFRLRIKR